MSTGSLMGTCWPRPLHSRLGTFRLAFLVLTCLCGPIPTARSSGIFPTSAGEPEAREAAELMPSVWECSTVTSGPPLECLHIVSRPLDTRHDGRVVTTNSERESPKHLIIHATHWPVTNCYVCKSKATAKQNKPGCSLNTNYGMVSGNTHIITNELVLGFRSLDTSITSAYFHFWQLAKY